MTAQTVHTEVFRHVEFNQGGYFVLTLFATARSESAKRFTQFLEWAITGSYVFFCQFGTLVVMLLLISFRRNVYNGRKSV